MVQKDPTRHVCFTINQKHQECPERFREAASAWLRYIESRILDSAGKIRYCCVQIERGEKLHLQGYAEFTKPQRFRRIKRLLGGEFRKRIHLERRRGTREQARDYCRKEESRVDGPYEFGEWIRGGQGARNDIRDLLSLAKQGTTLEGLFEAAPSSCVRYYRGVQAMHSLFHPPGARSGYLMPKMRVELHFGDPGAGKSWHAFQEARASPSEWHVQTGLKWWDGYRGQPNVILDDFGRGDIRYFNDSLFLRVTDRYPLRVQTKGAHASLEATRFVITSNYDVCYWFNGGLDSTTVQAIGRRITLKREYRIRELLECEFHPPLTRKVVEYRDHKDPSIVIIGDSWHFYRGIQELE